MSDKQYTIVGGTYYDARTPQTIISILEDSRINHKRIRLHYGQTDENSDDCGRDWNEIHDVLGHVGRSTGQIKIPLLIARSNSSGGVGILDHCIVKITDKTRTLYEHSKYYCVKD